LLVSLQHPTRDLSGLLTQLSECARAECDLYQRIWVSRARSRTSARIINGSVIAFSLGLIILNPAYVQPFLTERGLLVLLGITSCFVAGLTWLHHITTLQMPPRFLHHGEAS
jgi:Flp pilus assembly protein TadB